MIAITIFMCPVPAYPGCNAGLRFAAPERVAARSGLMQIKCHANRPDIR
jgi:hypothetical protein